MLQFMLAQAIAELVPDLAVSGYDLPDWGLVKSTPPGALRNPVVLMGQYVDVELTARLIRQGLLRSVDLSALGLRLEHYGALERYRGFFSPSAATPIARDMDGVLLINVRGAEVLGNVHSDYGPIPLAFYRQLVAETGLRPVFMGQIGNDRYSTELRRWFKDAEFLPTLGPIGDFQTIRAARHVVIGCSTFSWLAGWLSEARTIHVPVIGMLNPAQRPDIDLLPPQDPRYRFYRFPLRAWSAAPDQLAELFVEAHFPQLSPTALLEIRTQARDAIAVPVARYRRALARRALAQRLLGIGGGVIMKRNPRRWWDPLIPAARPPR
jgi:hypothetical protein